MDNKNSKITEEYKAEITSILSRISQDLGKSVTDSIEPKISSFTSSLEDNYRSIQEINNDQKANIEKASNYFSSFDDNIATFLKKLDSDVLLEKISTDINVFEQKIVNDNRSNKNEIINEIHKGSSKLIELIPQQKEVKIILQNLEKINSHQSDLLEAFEGKANFTNEKLAEIRKSIYVTKGRIKEENLIISNAITVNNELIEKTSEGTEAVIISQLLSFIAKIRDINNNQLEIQLKDNRTIQERTDKFTYLLIFIVAVVLVLNVFILFK